jgi:epoxyqueuosine reductase
MKKLLLHSCCAHCAAYPIEHWRREGWEVSAYWYNPNIHPYTEHQSRLEAMRSLTDFTGVAFVVNPGYDMVEFLRLVAGHESERCGLCFRLRLARTAQAAREGGFSAFTTTLLISQQQKHELIREAGEKVAREAGVEFLYADLRKRYSDSRCLTKPLGLYRQQYCGCIYSEWERYTGQE